MTRHAPVVERTPEAGFALAGLFTATPIDVVEDDRGIARLVAQQLRQLGIRARAVSSVTAEAQGVVFARGLSSAFSATEAAALHREALGAARALAARTGPRLFVTIQDTGGDFALSGRAGERAWTAGLSGIAKTASAEWPEAGCKAIDVASSALPAKVVAQRIVRELLLGDSALEVALDREGGRGTVRHRPASYVLDASGPRVRPGTVVVVSGGARGVTAASLVTLCKHHPRLALLGRTTLVEESAATRQVATFPELRGVLLDQARSAGGPMPSPKELARHAKVILDCREIRDNVSALQRAGAQVRYDAVDVRSAEEVRSVLGSIRDAWGPLQGIIHGAGVIADAHLGSQTDEQFDLVFGTKVDGLRHLLEATSKDPLELLLLFSSVAGRFGNAGQAAYAMANEVLSAVAATERLRRAPRCVVRSLAWGPWSGGMVTPGLGKLFERAGVQLVSLEAGAAALAREVESPDPWPQAVLMRGQPPACARPLQATGPAPSDRRFDVLVCSSTCAVLSGHRIKGQVVVPAVLVLEWFLRAATAFREGLSPKVCRDVTVLRGLPVEDFEGRGMRLTVQVRELEAAVERSIFELKLFDDQDRPRYAGLIETGAAHETGGARPRVDAPSDAGPWPWSVERAYEEVLFHRGPFTAIQSLGVIADTGATGEVCGLRDLGWDDGPWNTDVAAMDGALQIASLWATRLLGALPLPTRIGAFRLGAGRGALPPGSRIRCVVEGRRVGRHHVVADVALFGAGGAHLALLQQVDFHLPAGSVRPPASVAGNG